MNQAELRELLISLMTAWESEVVEFKEASNDYDTDKIGRYFSALSNEANLRGVEKAWLVFGVSDRIRAVTGTNYRLEPERLQSLKMQIAQNTEPSITFRGLEKLKTMDQIKPPNGGLQNKMQNKLAHMQSNLKKYYLISIYCIFSCKINCRINCP